jgi:tetratricopeptide (TPR) repeat protein
MRALELDDTLAEPHVSLAWVKFRFDWDWAAADAEFKRAIELNPRYATAHHWYSYYLSAMGRLDEARAEIRKAEELDPLSLIISATVGQISYYGRDYDLAIEQLEKTLELDQGFGHAHRVLGEAYRRRGRLEEAVAEMQKALTLSGGSRIYYLAQLGNAYAAAGRKGEALKILDELQALSRNRYISPTSLAIVYIGLGDADNALSWLERVYEDRSHMPTEFLVEPLFDGLRSQPRFQDLVHRMNFPRQSSASESRKPPSG